MAFNGICLPHRLHESQDLRRYCNYIPIPKSANMLPKSSSEGPAAALSNPGSGATGYGSMLSTNPNSHAVDRLRRRRSSAPQSARPLYLEYGAADNDAPPLPQALNPVSPTEEVYDAEERDEARRVEDREETAPLLDIPRGEKSPAIETRALVYLLTQHCSR